MTRVDQDQAEETLLGHYAGLTSRLMAFILDTIILAGVILFVSWFFVTTWKLLQLEPLVNELQGRSQIFALLVSIFTSPIFYTTITLLFVASYYVLFWTLAGQTPGKGIMGLKILSRRGDKRGKLSLSRAILRYLGFYLSIVPFGAGILWILIDDRRLAWHDKLAGTCVVYAWEAKPDETFLAIETSKVIARTQAIRSFLDKKRKNI
jgi:uncharacterized RDD family membrane protein YckC